jgi:heptosyltransferase-1
MKRVLLVRLGALGDLVHTLPLAAALRDAWPDARIDWLVDTRYRALLDLVPGSVINERFNIDMRALRGPSSVFTIIQRLRLASYDIAFDAQGLLKSALLARLSGASRVVGFTRQQLREPAAAVWHTETVDPSGATHVIEKSLSLLRAADIAPPPQFKFPLDIRPSPAPACTRELLGFGRAGDERDGRDASQAPFVLLNPGAAWPNKRWPPERFGALAREIHARHGLKSAVLWGPGEETVAAQIARASDGAAEMAPATDLVDAIALAREARLFISGDTGPTHLAAAVGTPIVGIYGPTDPARNGPWHPDDICISRFTACACHHHRRCSAATWCLTDIGVDEVIAAVDRRLEAASSRRATSSRQRLSPMSNA